jgi:hypothetical protein
VHLEISVQQIALEIRGDGWNQTAAASAFFPKQQIGHMELSGIREPRLYRVLDTSALSTIVDDRELDPVSAW